MRKKAFNNLPAHWEQSYSAQPPQLPDWREALLDAEITDNEELTGLFTTANLENQGLSRENVTSAGSFFKKDLKKIVAETQSRVDRFLKDYKYKVLDIKHNDNTLTFDVELTQKVRNPLSIQASFSFNIQTPKFLELNATTTKAVANQFFICNAQEYPINNYGFKNAFQTSGYKYANDNDVILTVHQLEQTYNEQDLINGFDNKQIVALDNNQVICKASFLNSLTKKDVIQTKNNSYLTERLAENESDSASRIANVDTSLKYEITETPEFKHYSMNSISSELKGNLGLSQNESKEVVSQLLNKNLLINLSDNSYISEHSITKLATDLGYSNKLNDVLKSVNETHITEKIQGEFREQTQSSFNEDIGVKTSLAYIEKDQEILGYNVIKDVERSLVKVATVKQLGNNEIPVEYTFCFNNFNQLVDGHAVVGKNSFKLAKLNFLFESLQKEYEKQELSSKIHADHKNTTTVTRDHSVENINTRTINPQNELDKYANEIQQLKTKITTAVDKKLLKEADANIFLKRIENAKQVSDLSQVEREFGILTELGDL